MNLRDLRYLVAVADQRHFRRAAEAENVSQPTLSAQIRKLEEELGLSLFERDSRNVALTPAGEAVLVEARAVLAHASAIRDIAAAHRDPLAGPLTLGVIASLGPFLAPDLLSGMKRQAPNIRLMVHEGLTESLIVAVKAHKLDAALVATVPEGDDLVDRLLFEEPFLIALPRQDALATRQSLSSRDIAGGTLLLLDEGHCLRDQAIELCRAPSVDVRVRATSLFTLLRLVANGAGTTLVPALAAPFAGDVALRPLTDRTAKRQVRLIVRRRFPRLQAIDAIASVVRSIAAEHRLTILATAD